MFLKKLNVIFKRIQIHLQVLLLFKNKLMHPKLLDRLKCEYEVKQRKSKELG
jgi:hypothetical protein